MPTPDLRSFLGLELPGSFTLISIDLVSEPMVDPLGRPALARTTIEGNRITIVMDEKQPPVEQSISVYHEVLEALTVAWANPPVIVSDFCEGDFEREAKRAHHHFGFATPGSVLQFLAELGFQ